MPASGAVLLTLAAYFGLLVLLGLVGSRRTHDRNDFYLGGRRLGPFVAALSAAASSSSAWTLLGVSGFAYHYGLAAVWLFPACVGGFLFNWYVLAGPLRQRSRRTGALTLTEVLATTQGGRSGPVLVAASLIILISLGSYVATQFQGAAKTFTATFQLPFAESLLLGVGAVVLYTLLGGFWAVSLTDTLQGLLMAAASLLLPAAALAAVGGPAGLAAGLAQAPPGYLDLWREAPLLGAAGFVAGLLGIGLGYPGQPHVVNRFMALARAEDLPLARRVAVGWAVLIYAGMILLGLCGRVLQPEAPDPEKVMITLTHMLFPPALAGVIVAAVLSAIMSTADSQLLVAAAAVTHDLAGQRPRTRQADLLLSRAVVLFLCAAAALAALTVRETIFRWVLFAWSAMGCAFAPPLIVTVLYRPVPPRRVLAAMLCGFLLSVAFYLYPPTRASVFDRVLPFAASLVLCIVPQRRP